MTAGILLCAYGSPRDLDDVARYLGHILGRAPPAAHLEDLRRRYAAVGGRTPLAATTERQAALLQQALGPEAVVALGYKHSAPFIAEAARRLVDEGCDEVAVLPLAAHDSRLSVGGYHDAARAAFAALPEAPRLREVRGFAAHPGLVETWAGRVRAAMGRLPATLRGDAVVLFTAHSLPRRVEQWNDPYPGEVQRTCEAVAAAADVARAERCYQSAAGPDWLGPDVLEAIDDLAARGARALVAAPVGFVSDHLETLYDLDVEAAQRAAKHGLAFERCPAPNDDPRFIACLADVARRALAGGGAP